MLCGQTLTGVLTGDAMETSSVLCQQTERITASTGGYFTPNAGLVTLLWCDEKNHSPQ